LSTLVFHQGVLLVLHLVGATDRKPFSMAPTAPFHVPQVFSLAFWGGVWGVLLSLVIPKVWGCGLYSILAAGLRAIAPTRVAFYVVFPLKGQPLAGGWKPAILVGALILNGAWGIGVALFMRLFGLRPRQI